MSENVYAVGDIQGCLTSLKELLGQLPEDAPLIFVGDIVNRGPDSLETLRFVKKLDEDGRVHAVLLGNHDLHLLAVAAGAGWPKRKDTITEILEAPDRKELLKWLRSKPLMYETEDTVFVHAAICPEWTLEDARAYAAEVSEALQGKKWKKYLRGMYGDDTSASNENPARMRYILNGFTRMRYVDANGKADFSPKMGLAEAPTGLRPWFDLPRKCTKTVCFGHWSTLGLLMRPDVVAIDTGCLWGGALTAVRFPDRRIYEERCPQWAAPSC